MKKILVKAVLILWCLMVCIWKSYSLFLKWHQWIPAAQMLIKEGFKKNAHVRYDNGKIESFDAKSAIFDTSYFVYISQYIFRFKMSMPPFSRSIFIRAVIDHMICYNLNWPKIKLWEHYFVFSCALDHNLKN